jgi:hypothetical protein
VALTTGQKTELTINKLKMTINNKCRLGESTNLLLNQNSISRLYPGIRTLL